MKRLFVSAALAATALGCGGYHYPGDITFHWTFAGSTCSALPQVVAVQVTIPGQNLDDGGLYDCDNGGTDGVQLFDFVAGSYDWSLEGEDSTGKALYTASGTLKVNGSIVVDADLTPVP